MNPILIVSPQLNNHRIWIHLLRERGYELCMDYGEEDQTGCEKFIDPSMVIFDLDNSRPLSPAWNALEELRARFPAVPLVALLPKDLPASYRRLLEQGTNGYLEKPVDCGGLLRLVDMFVVRQAEKRRIELGISRMLSMNPA